MSYNIGDKVKVISNLENMKSIVGVAPQMLNFRGNIVTIASVKSFPPDVFREKQLIIYKIKEDRGQFSWEEHFFESVNSLIDAIDIQEL